MADIGIPELLIILAIVVVLFGGSRIKDVGAALGRSIREFRQAVRDEPVETPVALVGPGENDTPSQR